MLAAASYLVKWPTAQGGANTVLTNSDGAGTLTWTSAGGTAWLVGGNTLSSGAQILGVVSGTSTLTIDSAGATALTFGAAQLATFAGSVTVTGASVITAGVVSGTSGSLVLNGSTSGTVTLFADSTGDGTVSATGAFNINTGGTTALMINTSQAATFASTIAATGRSH